MFDDRTRRGAQRSLNGFGTGLAGRGQDLNTAIQAFRPLLDDLEPVARNLADPATRLDRLFPALEATASEVAPVAETQAALFGNLDTTFTALAGVARPFLQQFISEGPPTLDTGIREFPRQRPFLRNSAAFFRELRPGVGHAAGTAPVLADALVAGRRTLPQTPPLNRQLASVFDSLAEFAEDPLVPRGIRRLRDTAALAAAHDRLRHAGPDAVQLRQPAAAQRGQPELRGRRQRHLERFIIVASPQGPNNDGSPSSAPANGPEPDNYLHANPYPNTASPGQPKECEAGNEEPWAPGRRVLGNVPGNQGIMTEGKPRSRGTSR